MSERIRVAVCIPSTGQTCIYFAQSLAELAMCSNVLRSRFEATGFDLTIRVRQSSNIPDNREMLVDEAVLWGCTHVLFLDEDMVFNSIILEMLLSRRQPFVACNYPKRQHPIEFTAAKLDRSAQMVTTKDSVAMEEAFYTGFGVALIEKQVFDKVSKPWFLPYYDEATKRYSTEDNPFCQRVREAGFKVLVDHTASRLIGHVGQYVYKWDDASIVPAEEAAPHKFELVKNEAA